MTAENQNFSVYPGDTHRLAVTVKNSSSSLPLQVTGAEFTWELFREPYHISAMIKTSEAGEITITNATDGTVEVLLKATDTQKLVFGRAYKHSLRMRDSDGEVSTVLTGKCIIKN